MEGNWGSGPAPRRFWLILLVGVLVVAAITVAVSQAVDDRTHPAPSPSVSTR